jgi:hypothetical protein
MPDAKLCFCGIGIGRTAAQNGGGDCSNIYNIPAAGSLRVVRFNEGCTNLDDEFMNVAIFR